MNNGVSQSTTQLSYIGVGTRGGEGTRGMCPPMFHKLLYKLLTTLCVVSDCAPPPPIKKSYASVIFSTMALHHVTDCKRILMMIDEDFYCTNN